MESMGNSDVKRLLPPALGPLYLDIWVDEGFTIFLNVSDKFKYSCAFLVSSRGHSYSTNLHVPSFVWQPFKNCAGSIKQIIVIS